MIDRKREGACERHLRLGSVKYGACVPRGGVSILKVRCLTDVVMVCHMEGRE